MEALEKGNAGKPKSFLIRLFGIFAILFGLPYLVQGISLLRTFFSRQYNFFMLNLGIATIAFDLVLGIASIFIGVGFFLHKEWARQSWLAFLPLLLFVHLHMTVLQLFAGRFHLVALYKWIAVVVVVTIISWFYLSKARVKSSFH